VADGGLRLGPQAPAGASPDGATAETPAGTLVAPPRGPRLLWALPAPRAEAAEQAALPPVDAAVVDARSPEAIAALRRAGTVTGATLLLAVCGGHGVHAPAEFDRRAALWGAHPVRDGEEFDLGADSGASRSAGRVLVTGGARSGKSAEAERQLLADPAVAYIATGPVPEREDGAWAARIAAHRDRRPQGWTTEETLDVPAALDRAAAAGSAVLLDCCGTWLAGVMEASGMWAEAPPPGAAAAVEESTAALVAAWRRFPGRAVAVTNEAGSGVVPATRSGGLFRDLLGRLNQRLAAESETVLLATAGRVTELP
ncbi:bifunctional adenosylcobinamide kinase/adenosylcobinamide-phosphate guanylyltransferase, partial [Nocardiopsis coralliicola]